MTSPSGHVPPRIRWAVESLQASDGDHILEVGCGRGVALGLLCERLSRSRVTGLDRSATAIAAAAARNARHLATGRLRLLERALAGEPLDGAYDVVFAVNVNVFWLRPVRELGVIRRCLKPDGRLLLFYDPPGAAQAGRILEAGTNALTRAGFAVTEASRVAPPPVAGVLIAARHGGADGG